MDSEYIEELLKDFKGKGYEDFASYIYIKISKKIDLSKGKQKDKYIKIRNRILKYVAANRSAIISKLHKVK
jgi:hypothetical protein